MPTSDTEFDPYEVTLFKIRVKLSAASDVIYVLARDLPDAVAHANKAFEDMNVLYMEGVERIEGSVFVSLAAKERLQQAFSQSPARK